MSKIRVIDLLNKIANGEDVPNIIKTNGIDIWIYDKEYKRYYLKQADYITLTFEVTDKLNDTVEIIEEEPEIDIQGIRKITSFGIKQNQDGINLLIRAVKQLDNQINNK